MSIIFTIMATAVEVLYQHFFFLTRYRTRNVCGEGGREGKGGEKRETKEIAI